MREATPSFGEAPINARKSSGRRKLTTTRPAAINGAPAGLGEPTTDVDADADGQR